MCVPGFLYKIIIWTQTDGHNFTEQHCKNPPPLTLPEGCRHRRNAAWLTILVTMSTHLRAKPRSNKTQHNNRDAPWRSCREQHRGPKISQITFNRQAGRVSFPARVSTTPHATCTCDDYTDSVQNGHRDSIAPRSVLRKATIPQWKSVTCRK